MINVRELSFTYPKQRQAALTKIDLTIEQGEIFGLLGPSGAGKSTLQKVLIGLYKHYSGEVNVLGYPAKSLTNEFYQRVGIGFEIPSFYQRFTLKENLDFFQSFYSQEKKLNYEPLLKKLGLGNALDKKLSQFSKGMKMRLNICRAFLHDPELIFLDEPTAGLDPTNTRHVIQLLLEKKQEGKTIIINTHNMAVASAICDRVAFIVDGQIKYMHSPKNVQLEQNKKIIVTIDSGGHIKDVHFSLANLAENHAFQQLLKEEQIVRIETVEKSLDDLFVEVTGRALD